MHTTLFPRSIRIDFHFHDCASVWVCVLKLTCCKTNTGAADCWSVWGVWLWAPPSCRRGYRRRCRDPVVVGAMRELSRKKMEGYVAAMFLQLKRYIQSMYTYIHPLSLCLVPWLWALLKNGTETQYFAFTHSRACNICESVNSLVALWTLKSWVVSGGASKRS